MVSVVSSVACGLVLCVACGFCVVCGMRSCVVCGMQTCAWHADLCCAWHADLCGIQSCVVCGMRSCVVCGMRSCVVCGMRSCVWHAVLCCVWHAFCLFAEPQARPRLPASSPEANGSDCGPPSVPASEDYLPLAIVWGEAARKQEDSRLRSQQSDCTCGSRLPGGEHELSMREEFVTRSAKIKRRKRLYRCKRGCCAGGEVSSQCTPLKSPGG